MQDAKEYYKGQAAGRKAIGRILRVIVSFLIGLCFNPQYLFAQQKYPNIIFILTDDHRWDAMSSMGHPFIKTPHLDSLADQGILFENAFVTTSLCSPSRASFLTGQYAHRHGVVTNHTPWDNRNVTFLELLKTAGYETAFIGKWHMPGKTLPGLRGVDQFISFTKEGGQGIYYNCPLIIDGIETERKGKYITEDLTDFALEFIEKQRTNPFCLYLSHKAVHFGFRPPPSLTSSVLTFHWTCRGRVSSRFCSPQLSSAVNPGFMSTFRFFRFPYQG